MQHSRAHTPRVEDVRSLSRRGLRAVSRASAPFVSYTGPSFRPGQDGHSQLATAFEEMLSPDREEHYDTCHMRLPWVIAHRGASAVAPENTMAAFRRAQEMGAECIETDLHLSRDGRLIILHDTTLDRTTSGSGLVKNHTYNELRQLDAGRWFSQSFAGERLPSIDELLDFAGQADLSLYLEIKGGAGYGVERAVISALRGRKESKATVVLCFDASVLDRIHQLDRLLMTGLLFESDGEEMVKEAVRVGARQIGPRGDCVTPGLIEDAHRRGLKVIAWTINEGTQMRALAAMGVDGIITNYPDRLLAVRESLLQK